MSDVADMSESNELAVLRERVKNLKELADYHREQLKDPEWRYQQAMEQLGASQRSMDSLTKALPAADHGSPGQRQRWRPFRKGQNREAAHSPLRRPVVPQVPAGIVNIISSAKCFLSGCFHQTGQNQEPSPQGSGWRCRSSVGQLRTATAKNRFPCIQPSPSIAARVLTRELARISLSPTLCPVKMPGPTTCYDLSDNRTVNKIGHLIERVHIEEDSLPGGGNIPGNGVPGSLWRRPRGNGNSRASTSHLDSRAHCHTAEPTATPTATLDSRAHCHLDSRAHCHTDCHLDSRAHCHTDCHLDSRAHCHTDCHLDSRAHCHTDCHLDSRAHCHADCRPDISPRPRSQHQPRCRSLRRGRSLRGMPPRRNP